MSRFILSYALVLSLGCSSSSSSPSTATADSGSDAALDVATDASDSGVSGCGAAPRVTLKGAVLSVSAAGVNALVGAKATSSLCPGATFVSGSDGVFNIPVARSTPVHFRVESGTTIPGLTPEYSFGEDFTSPEGTGFEMFSTDYALFVPDIKTKAYTRLLAQSTVMSGPCSDETDVAFSIPEAPGASIVYYEPGGKRATDQTKLVKQGVAIASDLPVGKALHLSGTKPGCTVTAKLNPETGALYAEVGTIGLAVLLIKP